MLLDQHIEFKNVKGVGDIKLQLSNKKMNVIIGSNGVGKTKTLESLYTQLLFSNKYVANNFYVDSAKIVFEKALVNKTQVSEFVRKDLYIIIANAMKIKDFHDFPVIYLAAQNRGEIQQKQGNVDGAIGEFKARKEAYINSVINKMQHGFSTLNMQGSIDEWFIQRANSSNRYQLRENNREVELLAVLRILNQIDARISADPEDFKSPDGEHVTIKLDGKTHYLNELSSGFASLIKIVQSIVAGYSYFTNAEDIEQVKGYVLIDEIESHLHIEWQTKILPLLTKIFPNTYFVITTHSSLVLTQLVDGAAYQLVRENDVVVAKPIQNAGQAALIDLLEEAFGVNLNKLRLENTTAESQSEVKKALLDLLGA